MSYSFWNLSVRVYWSNCPAQAHDAFDQMKSFLLQLRSVSSLFSSYYLVKRPGSASTPLDDALSNLATELSILMPADIAYANSDPDDRSFSLSCMSWAGFNAMFATVPSSKESGVWISIMCGASHPQATNVVEINISPEREQPDLLRALLDETVMFWLPTHGIVSRSKVDSLIDQPTNELRVGWLTYLTDPSVTRVVPPSVCCRQVAGGVVLQVSSRPGTADEPDYVHKVFSLRDVLGAHGYLRVPTPGRTA